MSIVAVRILARWTLLTVAIAYLGSRICLVFTFATHDFRQARALARFALVLVHSTGTAHGIPTGAELARRTVLALAIQSISAAGLDALTAVARALQQARRFPDTGLIPARLLTPHASMSIRCDGYLSRCTRLASPVSQLRCALVDALARAA